MEEVLATPLDHLHNLDKHLSAQKRHMLMQTSAGYPLEEYRKVQIFRKSVAMHHQMRECLGDYDKQHSDPLSQTYANITAYVMTHLPNIRAAAEMSSPSTTGRAFHASGPATATASSADTRAAPAHAMSMTELMCAYSVLEYKHKALQDRKKRPAGKGKGQTGKKQKGNRMGDLPDPSAPCKFYCHAHGSQNSHSSNQCKVMASQRQHFTEAMRNATSPTNPGGGSTLVRGKDPSTVTQATAYMMSAVTSEESDEDDANSPRNNEGPRPATPLVMRDEDESADTTHEDITYDHHAAYTAVTTQHGGNPFQRARMSAHVARFAAGCPDSETSPAAEQPASSADWRRINDRTFGTPSQRTELDAPKAPASQAATTGDALRSSTSEPTPSPRMSFFDEEYVQGRQVASPPPTVVELDFEPPRAVDHVRNSIVNLLAHSTWLPDFKEHRVPSIQRNPQVHHELTELMQQRESVERDLTDMLEDRAADGTPLDPTRNFDKDYERLNQLYDDLNRKMFTCYLHYLDEKAITQGRKRKADTALGTVVETDTPPRALLPSAGPAAFLDESAPSTQPNAELPPCPYEHASEQPPHTPTSPLTDTVDVHVPDNLARALLVNQFPTPSGPGVMAIADSGASHILIRHMDAHILHAVHYTRPGKPPNAVLTAANGASIASIGQGVLVVGGLALGAFVFADDNLANNLLGLVPFANKGCTSSFRPHTFHVFKPQDGAAILGGTRESKSSLWQVRLHRGPKPIDEITDGIPPPSQMKGHYIEAHAAINHDTASYVKFVHASLGYPAPNTFLRAVERGFINGPSQYPRLTTKTVRKYLPNAMATAKGHLNRTPSAQPHAKSDAVSARKRHHVATAQQLQATLGSKISFAPFSPADGPRSRMLHLDYTGPLPNACSAGTRYFQTSCWGGYINLQPLIILRAEHTSVALRKTVEFFRNHNVEISIVRMDNQQSPAMIQVAKQLGLQ
jgi:hypothetical protein